MRSDEQAHRYTLQRQPTSLDIWLADLRRSNYPQIGVVGVEETTRFCPACHGDWCARCDWTGLA